MAIEQPIIGTSTPNQRRAIILAGRRLGMDVDALRAVTTGGSLTALSFEEASSLLDRLNNGRERPTEPVRRKIARRSAPGVLKMITARQREVIASYQGRLEWTDARLDEFMRRTFGLTMATLARRHDASRAITVLRKLVEHHAQKVAASTAESTPDEV